MRAVETGRSGEACRPMSPTITCSLMNQWRRIIAAHDCGSSHAG
jgi:hypothetical protein